jgi:hypothetical protein
MPSRWNTTEILLVVGGSILVIAVMTFLVLSFASGQLIRAELESSHSELAASRAVTGHSHAQGQREGASVAELKQAFEALVKRRQEAHLLLKDREMWVRRTKWLMDHTPRSDNLDSTRDALSRELTTTTFANELTIADQTPMVIKSKDSHEEAWAGLTVEGGQDRILRWLLSLQGAEKFVIIESMDLELLPAVDGVNHARCRLALAFCLNATMPGTKH